MKKILLLCLTIITASCGGGGGGSDSCGTLSSKITGGSSCSPEGSPVVAVVPVISDGTSLRAIGACAGTIVTSDDVLTAAHCPSDPLIDGADGFVVVTASGVYPVTRYQINPFYSGTGSPFDTAMVTVGQSFGVAPVPINASDLVEVGEKITVYGYGKNEDGQSFLDNGLGAFKSGEMIVNSVLPGGFIARFDDTGAAICQGDSGGPVIQVVNGVPSIVGVTSVTIRGCVEGSASGFVSMQIKGNVQFVLNYAGDVQVQ